MTSIGYVYLAFLFCLIHCDTTNINNDDDVTININRIDIVINKIIDKIKINQKKEEIIRDMIDVNKIINNDDEIRTVKKINTIIDQINANIKNINANNDNNDDFVLPPTCDLLPDFYLSVVVTARNDAHGGDFMYRLTNQLQYMAELTTTLKIDIEFVVVEWNPLDSRDRIVEVIERALLMPYSRLYVRIITVPPSLHSTTQNHDKIPVQQYIGKNVGIRRARGQYILASNADIIFSHSFIKFLKSKYLRKHYYYRTNLLMVSTPIPFPLLSSSWEDHLRAHTHFVKFPGTFFPLNREDSTYEDYWLWFDIKSKSSYWTNITPKVHLTWENTHRSAPGDFLMMHRSQWYRLRGHPELGLMNHVDLVMTVMCATLYEEIILPPPSAVYHQFHYTKEWKMDANMRPDADNLEVMANVTLMMRERKPLILNGPGWGMVEEDLEDVYLLPGREGRKRRYRVRKDKCVEEDEENESKVNHL